jgi:hypothetical protein
MSLLKELKEGILCRASEVTQTHHKAGYQQTTSLSPDREVIESRTFCAVHLLVQESLCLVTIKKIPAKLQWCLHWFSTAMYYGLFISPFKFIR